MHRLSIVQHCITGQLTQQQDGYSTPVYMASVVPDVYNRTGHLTPEEVGHVSCELN